MSEVRQSKNGKTRGTDQCPGKFIATDTSECTHKPHFTRNTVNSAGD